MCPQGLGQEALVWSPSVNWSQQTTVRQSIYRRLIGKLCVGGPGRNVSQQWSTYGPALSQPRSVSLREPEQCLTISYSDSNIATACSPRLLSSLVEKLRSKMCGQLRAAFAGPLVSPSCLWCLWCRWTHLQPLSPGRMWDAMSRCVPRLQMLLWSWYLQELRGK